LFEHAQNSVVLVTKVTTRTFLPSPSVKTCSTQHDTTHVATNRACYCLVINMQMTVGPGLKPSIVKLD